jgi:uncharacterized protein YkwD
MVEDVPQMALNTWLNDPDSRKVLEGDYVYMGVGVAHAEGDRWFITQILVNAL